MTVQPRGEVIIYKDVKISGTTQLVWSSSSERNSYFASKKVGILNEQDYSYVQHSGNRVKIMLDSPEQYFTLTRCNYVTFYNEGFENIVWYASLYDWERINNHTAEVTFDIDYFQTYYFNNDLSIYTGQVAREGLSVADYNTLQTNPWANVPQMFTGEPLYIDNGMEGLINLVNVEGSVDHNDSALNDFNNFENSGIRYKFKKMRAVIIAFQDEKGYGFNSDQPFNSYSGDPRYNKINKSKYYANNSITEGTDLQGIYISYPFYFNNNGQESVTVNKFNYSFFPQPLYVCVFDIASDTLGGLEIARMNKTLDQYALNNITSSIIGVFFLPECAWGPGFTYSSENESYSNYGEYIELPINKIKNNYSPKLQRAPYQNIRVTDWNGVNKSYIIEEFNEIVNGSKNHIDFGLAGSLIGVPTISLCPINYKRLITGSVTGKYGTDERFVMSNFPQIPYVIDGYLTYVSSSLQDIMSQYNNKLEERRRAVEYSNTINRKVIAGIEEVAGGLNVTSGLLTTGVGVYTGNAYGVGLGIGNVARGGQSIAKSSMDYRNANFDATQLAAMQDLIDKEKERRSSGGEALRSEYYESFFGGPESYLQDNYVPPAGDIIPFMLDNMYMRVEVVHLRDDIRQQYDKFFKLYGYTSGLIKVPYIYNYIKGISGDTNQPHWEAITDLKESNNDEYYDSTYCQMTRVNISGVNQEAEQWLTSMFLNGMRFLRRHQ